jgi:DMSO/TMAO reductase YedYZ molybdopterin-dependent catalytic subunit
MNRNRKPTITRRHALELGGVAALGAFAAACARATDSGGAPSDATPAAPSVSESGSDVSGLQGVGAGKAGVKTTPSAEGEVAITPNADFYTVAYRVTNPPIPADWSLTVTGLVDNPLALTLQDIQQLETVEEMRTLECISNPAGGTLIGNAIWKAVRLTDVLDMAKFKPTTRELKLESFDGYSTAVPLELGLDPKSLLAFEMNGVPLPVDHGFPLRVIWPGRYGMKQPKWLQRITAIADHYLGYWESQGWSNQALVLPNSRIDTPEDGDVVLADGLQVRGVAFADGNDGIAKLDVSFNDGESWQETTLVRGPNPFVWTNWAWRGTVPTGTAVLLARVTTNSGKTQDNSTVSLLGDTFPNGSSAIHQVVVNVKS